MKSEFACKEWGGDLHLSLCWGPPPHLGGEGPYLYRASGRQEGGGSGEQDASWGAGCLWHPSPARRWRSRRMYT